MKVSIIIITWNRLNSLCETLENIINDPYPAKEMVVIDNNSDDGTDETIPQRYPEVIYKKCSENLGVPGGRNEGIKIASGDILFFLDNDAELMEDGLSKIVSFFEDSPEMGILAPQINNYYSRKLDLSSWVYTIHKLKDKDVSFPSFYFVGCAFAVRRAVFDECGLLWNRLFFMHEEQDLAYRVIEKGYTIQYIPDIKIYHKVSPEHRYNISSRFYYYGTRNTVWIYFRYYPIVSAFSKSLKFLVFQDLAAMRSGNVSAFLKGLIAAVHKIRIPLTERFPLSVKTLREIERLQYVKKDSLTKRFKRVMGISGSDYEEV